MSKAEIFLSDSRR